MRVKPKRVPAAQESSTSPGSWARTASSSASDGSGSITSPTDSIPYSERIDIVTSTRARAASRSSPESISWPTAGWFCGAATATKGDLLGPLAHGRQQLAPAGNLVEEDEQGLRPGCVAHAEPTTDGSAGTGASTDSPGMIAWRAPGTPYS